MGKFDGWLLCTDVDGTLIDDKQHISDKNIEAINYFKNNGGAFTFATGRHYLNIMDRAQKIMPTVPVVVANGCGIYDPFEKRYKMSFPMPEFKDAVKNIQEQFPFSGIEIIRKEDVVFYRENNATRRHYLEEQLNNTVKCGNLDKIDGECLKVLLAQEEEETNLIDAALKNSPLREKYKLVKCHKWYYEFFNKNANKGEALKCLIRELDINPEKVIAIGDNYNDLEMISLAGISAAPLNAEEKVKNAADIITCDNNSSALYGLIKILDEKML